MNAAAALISASVVIAVPAAGDDGPVVTGNIVVSKSSPELAIKVAEDIPYLGRHSIRIRDVAAGERLVFADVDGVQVKRMVILQFEGFLPSVPEATYRYNFDGRPIVAGYPFRSNPFSFDLPKARAENPGSESADTAAFLESKGIEPPNTWMMWRSLTAELPERRDELIIFYVENGDPAGVKISQIYDPETDQSTAFWRGFMVGLERRANAAFRVAVPRAGAQESSFNWQSVPHVLSGNSNQALSATK